MTRTLAVAIDATQNNVQLDGDLDAQPGDLFRLDDELVEFGSYLALDRQHAVSRSLCSFGRGVDGTTAASHTAGTEVLGAVEAVESGTTSVIPDPFPSGGGGGLVVTDGSTTVDPATTLLLPFDMVVDDGGGQAQLVIGLSTVLESGTSAGGSAISNLADPTDAQDAATKHYVGVALAAYVPPIPSLDVVLGSGGNDAGAFRIIDLAAPIDPDDAATKAYVDAGDVNPQAAFVDPTTATPEAICNALIAAGLMAAS